MAWRVIRSDCHANAFPNEEEPLRSDTYRKNSTMFVFPNMQLVCQACCSGKVNYLTSYRPRQSGARLTGFWNIHAVRSQKMCRVNHCTLKSRLWKDYLLTQNLQFIIKRTNKVQSTSPSPPALRVDDFRPEQRLVDYVGATCIRSVSNYETLKGNYKRKLSRS